MYFILQSTSAGGSQQLIYSHDPALNQIRHKFLAWLANLKKPDDKELDEWMIRAQDVRPGYAWDKNKKTKKWEYFIPTPIPSRPQKRMSLYSRYKLSWIEMNSSGRKHFDQKRANTDTYREQRCDMMAKLLSTMPRLPTMYLLEVRELDPSIIKAYKDGDMTWEELTRVPAIRIWRYPGVHESVKGLFGPRPNHFQFDPAQAQSKVHDLMRALGLDNCICMEAFSVLCKDLFSAQQGESYAMVR